MDLPRSPSLSGAVLLILLLTAINAFLAGAEMAFVSLNPAKIKEKADKGDKRARRVQTLLADSDSFLSAIQVGITLAGFFNSASAAQAFVGRLSPLLGGGKGAEALAVIVVTLLIAYVTLVMGELYPKQLALQVPEAYAMRSAGPILFLRAIFRPFIWLLNVSTGLIKKLTPIDFSKKEEKLTRQEIRQLLSSSRNDGAIDMEEFNMMRGVLSLDSRLVREIMVPRVSATMLDLDDPQDDNIALVLKQMHSRVPLYRDNRDNVLGILHMKDMLINIEALRDGSLQLIDIARPALFVPDTMVTDELLLQFQKEKQHLAILVDEFGGMSGLVTLEDLIEEIVGDIRDEYDEETGEIEKTADGSYLLAGALSLSDFNRYFETALESEEADTIAGFVIERVGFIPEAGTDTVLMLPEGSFTVTRANITRIEQLSFTPQLPPPEEDEKTEN